eukprot:scpid23713/ scgid32148/ Proto-oncogene tyrosine-protein kinase ROS; Proto-oncogene c-Ros; Proto-oncogene c-Ros-1; Receptor tyrosine kinase c-ros oncogene 1; c-Ros receptor tyrosine kinase
MSSTCRGDGRMDHFCRLILLLVLVLSLSALPVVLVGAQCPVLQANESHVELCADSCESQLRNRNVSSNESYALRREADSIFCYQYCELAYTRGLCHCRTAKCWRSLPCLVACGIAGVFDHVASGTNTLQTCLRTTVYPDRSISMDVAWLPLVHDLKHLGLISTYGATYRPADSVNDGNFVVDHPHQVYQNSLLPGILHVSCDVTNTDTSYQWNNIVPYNVIIFLRRIDYQIVGQPRHTELHNHRRAEQRPFISSPACHHVVDNLSQCLDKQYNITVPTEYYDKIVITDFKVQNAKGDNTVAAPSIVDGAGLESYHYTLALDALWWYELFEHRGTGLTASAWDHAAQSCTPHSCWCWESCDIRHVVSAVLIITTQRNTTVRRTQDFETVEENPEYVHCPHFEAGKDISLSIAADQLYDGAGLSKYPVNENVTILVTVTIRSYYKVDVHFGPLRNASVFNYTLENVLLTLSGGVDGANTPTPLASRTVSSSTSPLFSSTIGEKASNGSMLAVTIPVALISSVLVLLILIGIFTRAWKYQKWRPQCVARNNTLEKLQKIRVTSTFQNSTNMSYQSATRCSAMAQDWPTVPRSNINLEIQLGSGQFGEVYRATVHHLNSREASTQVAIKVLKEGSSEKDEHDFLREASHLKSFRHPNVIRLLGVCLDEDPKMILLELMDGGDLLSYLQSNKPGAARPAWDDAEYIDIALDITAGLRYLETEKYVHRDVAARNCLVSFCPKNSSLAVKPSSSGRIVKIADFGLARDIDQRHYYRLLPDREALLPLRWLAPESLQKKIFTTKSDVWSFGILLWEIYTYGQLPYGEKTQGHEIYTFVLMGGTLDQPQFCPNAMYKLMKHAWAKSPADRPTFTQLRDHLSTFQNSLSRRKTLLTTLASFASVSGIGEVERANLPHIPPSQRVMVAPRPSSAQGSVFDSESMASDSENVFESPAVTPAVTPLSHRRTAAGFQPQTQPKFSSDFLTIPDAAISTRQLQQHQPQSRKSRCDSATGDGIATSETSPVKTLREFPVTANGISSPGYTAVVSTSHNHLPPFGSTALEQSTPKQRQCSPESHPTPLVITEFASRKTLSPIVSASSTTDDGMEPSSSLLTGARRKTRSTNSSSSRRKPSYSETCL